MSRTASFDEGAARSPVKFVQHSDFPRPVRDVDADHDMWQQPVREIPHGSVVHTHQAGVDPAIVEHYRRGTNPADHELTHGEAPWVVKHQGKLWATDGHHRLAAGYGRAHFLDLDKP